MKGEANPGSTTEFRILGPLRVLVDGEERPVSGEKLQALLARLLLEANQPVSADRLIDDLWNENPPATARQSLHTHVARLRHVLSAEGEGSSPLVNDRRGYVLRVDDEQLDAARFRAGLAAAREERRAGKVGAARERYADALALWRGEVLDGVVLERADAERSELEGLRQAAVEERIEADLELGRAAELVPELERIVQADPLRERPRAQLMLALYASGRQADALAAYQDARRELDALGLSPGRTLRELEQRILEQDPSLATAPVPTTGRRNKVRWASLAALAVAAVAVAAITALVGRDDGLKAAGRAAPLRAIADRLVEIDYGVLETRAQSPELVVSQPPESNLYVWRTADCGAFSLKLPDSTGNGSGTLNVACQSDAGSTGCAAARRTAASPVHGPASRPAGPGRAVDPA